MTLDFRTTQYSCERARRLFAILLFLAGLAGLIASCGTPPKPTKKKVVSTDNDNDGIPNTKDACPDTAEDFDGDVDGDGCPEDRKLVVVSKYKIELNEKLYFATNKTRVLERSTPLLDEIADVLLDNPKIHIRIEGHTDDVGPDQTNEKLSQGRADAVREAMIDRGIQTERLDAVGFGERRPIADNESDVGRSVNRRVEIHITAR